MFMFNENLHQKLVIKSVKTKNPPHGHTSWEKFSLKINLDILIQQFKCKLEGIHVIHYLVFSSHKRFFFFINLIYIIFMAQTIDKDVIYLCTRLLYKIYYQLPSCIPHRFLLHRLLTECGEIREINVQVQERLINDLTCSIQNQTYHFWTIFCCWK